MLHKVNAALQLKCLLLALVPVPVMCLSSSLPETDAKFLMENRHMLGATKKQMQALIDELSLWLPDIMDHMHETALSSPSTTYEKLMALARKRMKSTKKNSFSGPAYSLKDGSGGSKEDSLVAHDLLDAMYQAYFDKYMSD